MRPTHPFALFACHFWLCATADRNKIMHLVQNAPNFAAMFKADTSDSTSEIQSAHKKIDAASEYTEMVKPVLRLEWPFRVEIVYEVDKNIPAKTLDQIARYTKLGKLSFEFIVCIHIA